jgi:enamine deaminase RidA (YjgF/YER057c/UK114 family)
MDMESRRRFVNSMMAATAAAMGGPMLIGQSYTPMGGVQIGPDGVNGNPPPGPIGAGGARQGGGAGAPAGGGAAPGGGRGGAGGAGGGAARVPRPKPAGIYWISGTGTEKTPAINWDLKDHVKITMDNVKNGVERLGGTMASFLYMQVFFCLRNDDSAPKPTGSAANAAYQQAYLDINSVYNTYWPGGAPPRSCFALTWIPGNSLIEVSAAAWIDPSIVPPPAPPRAPRAAAPAAPPA